jgi:molybdopterin synthase catalytic subunit
VEANIPFITEDSIKIAELLSQSSHPKAGAIVLFSGEVRNHNQNREVLYLEYEAFKPMAEKMIGEIVEEASKKWDLHLAICQHRLGKVEIGESAVVVITAASHRDAAYEANRFIMEKVKFEAPIWKREYFADGSNEWGHNSGKPVYEQT